MGQGSSAGKAKCDVSVSDAQASLANCKWSLNLEVADPYPQHYDGRCDSAEYDLKKAISFQLHPKAASVLYDRDASREARVAANRILQPKLERFRWVAPRH